MSTQKFCTECGTEVFEIDKFCGHCGVEIVLKEQIENNKGSETKVTGKGEEQIASRSTVNNQIMLKSSPLYWFKSYIFFSILFQILLIDWLSEFYTISLTVSSVVVIVLMLLFSVGFYKRKLWGWYLNFFILIFIALLRTKASIYYNTSIFNAFGFIIVIILPSLIFLKKSRYLFK